MIDNKEIEKIRQQLETERKRLQGGLEDDDTDETEVSYNLGRGELATDARRQYREEALDAIDEQKLAQINSALASIKAGTYGQCANCDKPINIERLHALPYSTLCMDCQSEESNSDR